MLLIYVIYHNIVVRQIDINIIFLYDNIDYEIYIAIFESIIANQREIYKLRQSIYKF
jgi:hypothetical protein